MNFPTDDMALTHILVVSDLQRSKTFYSQVLGADVHREYGGTSVVLSLLSSWILLVTGGPPTVDKPDVTFAVPVNPRKVSHAFTIRVPDCNKAYKTLKSRGAEFLTPPKDWGNEIRCFLKDPDGHLLEISETT